MSRNKTYDVNAVFEEEPPMPPADDEVIFMGETWEGYEIQCHDSDPDAVACMQFEDGLGEALQCDSEIAACYNTYLDARKRLADKGKNHGFWNPKGNPYSQKGKGKGKSENMFKGRKPLAQRILESECRRCGMKGHWKAECPSAAAPTPGSTANAFAGTVTAISGDADDQDMIVAESLSRDVSCFKSVFSDDQEFCFVSFDDQSNNMGRLTSQCLSRFLSSKKQRLSPQPEIHSEPCLTGHLQPATDVAIFVSHGPCGIMDLGASQTVIGSD